MLVRYLVDELDRRYRGADVREVFVDSDQRLLVLRIADETLSWHLHPTEGWVRVGAPPPAQDAVPVHHRATIQAVTAPEDERLLAIEIASPGRSRRQARRIVIELMTNQWNALVLNRHDRILAVAWPRDAGDRRLRASHEYQPPSPLRRSADLDPDAWLALLEDVPPAERERTLVRTVAYTSPMNAGPILGDAVRSTDAGALRSAHGRYRDLIAFPPAAPRVLALNGRRQPYPIPLPGTSGDAAPTLLDAMAAAAGAPPPEEAPRPVIPPDLLERLRRRIDQLEGRRKHLREELEGAAPRAAELRRRADLLLSQLHTVQKGMETVELSDFAGGSVTIDLDPALSPTENADRLYEKAQKRDRAAERLPDLIRETEREHEPLIELLQRVERGEAEADEVVDAVGSPEEEADKKKEPEKLPPYRRYRTSGGLEVRVGRNRKANDELTFHQSSPNDIWMHARDVAGSHVILRWDQVDANPPNRDLLESAVLAALNSRARTSGTVPVDWTRRKYVRKPRKSPPGLVIPNRVQTIFVEPDPAVGERMRDDA